ncbi:hypothetical protein BE221DRAFT_47401, partial [Ostreococcus tauri]
MKFCKSFNALVSSCSAFITSFSVTRTFASCNVLHAFRRAIAFFAMGTSVIVTGNSLSISADSDTKVSSTAARDNKA